jgi:hypothetical protein
MMGLRFKNKKAAKEALEANGGSLGSEHIIETSFFGAEFKPGQHAVCVSLDPYTVRNYFATITVVGDRIVAIK